MINFVFHNPTKIIFGKNTHHTVGTQIKATGAQKVLFHYGSGSIKKTGLYNQIIDSLKDANVKYVELGGVQPNPRLSLVYTGIDMCKREGVDFILAVGGGSTIDSAKAIALGATTRDNVWDFFEGKPTPSSTLPVGVVLTIPAAGSETSDSLVITNENKTLKRAIVSDIVRPVFAILNPELTLSLSPYQTACGISDMLAHVLERYFTTVSNVAVIDSLCEALMRSIMSNAKKLKLQPDNYDIRAEIMWAATIAHNDLLSTGRIGDWASHSIEHELSAEYDIAHGAGLAIVFPAWMKYQHKVDVNRFVHFATRVMNVHMPKGSPEEIVLEGIRLLEEFYISIGLPIRLCNAGINDDRFRAMADRIKSTGNFRKLYSDDIVEIYKLAAN